MCFKIIGDDCIILPACLNKQFVEYIITKQRKRITTLLRGITMI